MQLHSAKKRKNTTTASSVEGSSFCKKSKKCEWIKIWWPAVLLTMALSLAGIAKYVIPNEYLFGIAGDATKAIGVLMAVMYVIYTRVLATETKNMAEASIGMYYYGMGTIITELNEISCNYNSLCDEVKKLIKEIHVKDKNFSEKEFDSTVMEQSLPAFSLKLRNRSGRGIDTQLIEYTVRHTGEENGRKLLLDISKNGDIDPWKDKDIVLFVYPEGEIEITVHTIEYYDGKEVKKVEVDITKKVGRIRKPEGKSNG